MTIIDSLKRWMPRLSFAPRSLRRVPALPREPITVRGQLLILVLVWLAFWAAIGIGQALGWGTSLRVWPSGEDYNWLYMLEQFDGMETAKVFWQIDRRNPLAAWWYLAAKPFLLADPSAWFFLRRLVELGLAITVLFVLRRFDREASPFPLFAAVGVLFASYTGYPWTALNIWTMSMAMIAGLWSLYAYSRHVESGRGGWLGLSLVLYLIAVGTYTLQATVLLAVPLIGGRGRVRTMLGEAALFVVVFAAFYAIWVTATPSGAYSHERLSLQRMSEQFGVSVVGHLLPPYGLQLARSEFSVAQANRVLLAVALPTLLLLSLVVRRNGGLPSARSLGGALWLAASVAAGSTLLESMSDTFVPGTRSVMVAQVVVPIVYAVVLFAVVKLLAEASCPLARTVQVGAASALIAFAALMTVTLNRQNAKSTRVQLDFCRAVNATIGELPDPTYLVVFAEGEGLNPVFESPALNRTHSRPNRLMVHSILPGKLTESESHGQLDRPGCLIFGEHGVKLTPWFTTPPFWVPYQQVVFVRWVEKRLEFLTELPPSYLNLYRVALDGSVTLEGLRLRVGLGAHRLVVAGALMVR